ncbi:MAG: hypothetical protein HYU57_02980 [Micavibrio aeruginosavorus]|nr:hypothetical protein [Micavibrio aeruginosavorus]
MGKVVSIDLIRQLRREGRNAGAFSGGGDDGDGPDGVYPSEYIAMTDLFAMARDAGLVLKMSLQPYGEGFLFRAFSVADPYYTLFEIQKVRTGKFFEYHGRVRHQLLAVGMNFYPFMSAMRAEVVRLIDLFGPDRPHF